MAAAVISTDEYRLIPGRLRISVKGLHHNPKYAQYLVKQLPCKKGIQSITANPLTGRVLIYFDHKLIGFSEIQRFLQSIGQEFFSQPSQSIILPGPVVNEASELSKTYSMYTLTTGGILAGLVIKRWLVGKSPVSSSPHIFNLAALTTIVAGYPILYDGLGSLTKRKKINHDLLLFLTSLILLTMRESITGLSILWLVHLSNLFRFATQVRANENIDTLVNDKQHKGWRLSNLQNKLTTSNDIHEGDVVVVHSGETIPVDGHVMAGKASITQAAISGDCQPQLIVAGETVFAGTQIRAGSLKVKATSAGNTTSVAQIAELAAQAQRQGPKRSPPNRYINRLMWWTLGISGTLFFLTHDFMRSLAILLAGCPAAISLSRSTALSNAVSVAAKQGIYAKDIEAIERIGHVDTILFDKTGTLTTSLPMVTDIKSLSSEYTDLEVLVLAASAEKSTRHPLARMLTGEIKKRKLALLPATHRSVLGCGVQAMIADKKVIVGNHLCMNQQKVFIPQTMDGMFLKHMESSILYVAVEGRLIGLICVHDVIRPESYSTVQQLHSLGIKNIGIVTGDSAIAAETTASALNVKAYWNSMLPRDKMQIVASLQQAGKQVAMVGDGINDSPAFAISQVGIAMGTIGTEQAIRAADIVIANDDLRKVAHVRHLGRRTAQIVKQNIALSTGLNLVGMALAAARLMTPMTAGVLLNISTLAVILNSGRLLAHKTRRNHIQMDLQRFAEKDSMTQRSCDAPNNLIHFPINRQAQTLSDTSQPSWHIETASTVCDRLETSNYFGLTQCEAKLRICQYGKNILKEPEKPSFWKLLCAQFKDFMVKVLLGAAGLALAIGKTRDALLTIGIVTANAVLGVMQETKASSSLDSLQKLSAPQARVTRGGKTVKMPAENLVPGDIVILEAGDRIPADVRLLSSTQFEVEESALTGEPLPIRKDANAVCPLDCPLADRSNMAFRGTSVTRGRATGVVIATGMATEMGKIASLIQDHEDKTTPLQRRLEELGKYLVYGCLGVSGIVFLAGILRGQTALSMLQTSASLTVAAIPEGLSAIVIIALAMGVQRMSKRNIIIRKLSSIETLGCATAICSDKTGTLTQNKMTVREIYTLDRSWQISGDGYTPHGDFLCNNTINSPASNDELTKTLKVGALCNNAKLIKTIKQNENVIYLHPNHSEDWIIDGDPTEGAIVVAAIKAGLDQQQLSEECQRLAEFPFESDRRMMSVVCQQTNSLPVMYSKGAPDKILSECSHYVKDGLVLPLDESTRTKIEQAHIDMAEKAMRVLACAYRNLPHFNGQEQDKELEVQLVFCGLVGMVDPPRPEVTEAMIKCKAAGVKVIMITGDHPVTAKAIACEIGLIDQTGHVALGAQLDTMSDAELEEIVSDTQVYARTSPQQKLRIVKALKQRGLVVAMTGDGVNDAPAVKCADIGIAMGIMGTDVTKQAASMTLADDNFATIVRAMEEGRSIYANIRKAIRYLVATNIGEVILMLLAAIVGLPLPLLPIQLLWINLIGDGLPAVALVNDPPAKNIMNQPPKTADQSVLSDGLGRKVITRGIIIGITSLALFAWKLARTGNLLLSRTIVLAQLAISQFIHLFDCRIERGNSSVGFFSNPWLIGAFSLSMLMIVGIIHSPLLQPMFGTAALTGGNWLIAALLAGLTSAADFAMEGILGQRCLRRFPAKTTT